MRIGHPGLDEHGGGGLSGEAGVATSDLLIARVNKARTDLHREFRPTRVQAALQQIADDALAAGEALALAAAELELAALARHRSELVPARTLAIRALRCFADREDRARWAAAHIELAIIDLVDGQSPELQLELARHSFVDPRNEIEARIESVRAQVHLGRGDLFAARRLLERSVALVDRSEESGYYKARYLASWAWWSGSRVPRPPRPISSTRTSRQKAVDFSG